MENNKNIFDKVMHLPGARIVEPFYRKHKEIVMYLFFGGVAFFLNLFMFVAIDKIFPISELINNIICWIVCVTFQYITNKKWVFDGKVESIGGVIKQILSFFGGRLFTLAIEEAILGIFITWLHFSSIGVKLAAQIIVIILNYVISKLIVFRYEKS